MQMEMNKAILDLQLMSVSGGRMSTVEAGTRMNVHCEIGASNPSDDKN